MKRWLWSFVPCCRLKRAWCGGFWTRYQTSLPMAAVWHQDYRKPGRLPCQLGGHLAYEDHGSVYIDLYV